MSGFTINTVTVGGNLTRDPELRATSSGRSVCRLSLAVNERYKDSDTGTWSDRANYFDVTVWGGVGEWVANNVGKGDGLVVQGRLRWESWTAQDGGKRSAVRIVADSIMPQRSTDDGPRSSSRSESREPVAAGASAPPSGDMPQFGSLSGDDDIPF